MLVVPIPAVPTPVTWNTSVDPVDTNSFLKSES